MKEIWKRKFKSPMLFIWIMSIACLLNLAMGYADVHNHMADVDVQTYTSVMQFEIDEHQSPTRRYRVIIPMLAAGVHYIFGSIFSQLEPDTFPGDFSIIISFVIVNTICMSLFCLVVFKIVGKYIPEHRFLYGILGLMVIFTCRWTLLITGSALVDSLYLCMISLFLFGILCTKQWAIITSIFIGPWAKESFIFFLPLLFFYKQLSWKILLYLGTSGILVFLFRLGYDRILEVSVYESIDNDLSHVNNITPSLHRLLSFHGLYEIYSIGGIWNIFIFGALALKNTRNKIIEKDQLFWITFMFIVFIHVILSSQLARMFYLSIPLISILVARSIQLLQKEFQVNYT